MTSVSPSRKNTLKGGKKFMKAVFLFWKKRGGGVKKA